jgi:Putative zinc-finger
VNAPACQSPLAWSGLLEYWLGELDSDSEARIEEHYLGCPACSGRLAQLAALARLLRAVARKSGVNLFVNEQFVHRLLEDGLHVREYRVPRYGSVNCTVTPEDEFVVARLEVPLAGEKRVDMVYLDSDGEPAMRLEDIPFIAESGGVLLSTGIDALRALPAVDLRVRLLAIDHDGERTLGEYTFNHTPYASRPE